MTPEQRAKVPYQDKPATATDVAEEISALVALVTGGAGHQSVVVQETRLALALGSWQASGMEFVATTIIEAAAGQ